MSNLKFGNRWWAKGRWQAFLLAMIILAGIGSVMSANSQETKTVNTHVTIYLEPPILGEGGAVIVTGMPVSLEEWRKIPKGENPAADDMENPKREQIGPQDRHFGAIVSSPVTVVEFPYPEEGSYTFNFLPAPAYREAFGADLKTKMVLSGTGSRIVDPETKKYVDWPSIETIAVLGSKRDQGWTRMAKATFTRAFDEKVIIKHYEGIRTIALTSDQISKYVVEPK